MSTTASYLWQELGIPGVTLDEDEAEEDQSALKQEVANARCQKHSKVAQRKQDRHDAVSRRDLVDKSTMRQADILRHVYNLSGHAQDEELQVMI